VFLNILLPVYNEERRITKGVEGTVAFLKEIGFDDYRITIEDNASKDRTEEIARELCERYPQVNYERLDKKGVGVAFRNGVKSNPCDIVGYMDIDLSTDIRHLEQVINIFKNEPDTLMVNGSRFSKTSDTTGRKWYRNLSSYGLTFLLKLRLHMKASDSICGFKFFRKDFVEKLIAESGDEAGWFFIIELLLRAERKGSVVRELPVRWQDDYDSKVDYIKVISNYLKNISRLRKQFRKEGIL